MLNQILQRFKQQPNEAPIDHRRLATAVLLYEVALADDEHHPLELEAVRKTLVEEFGVTGEELDELLAEAGQERDDAISMHDFIMSVNRQTGQPERIALLQLLWRVAYADGKLDPHEEHRIRNIADWLHVPHSDFIRTKLQEEKLGPPTGSGGRCA